MWHPPVAKLAAFRRAVADDPEGVRRLIDEPRIRGDLRSPVGRGAEARSDRLRG